MSRVQQGHRCRRLMSATIRRRRIVVIEFGMWRSVLSGSASRSVTLGKRSSFERPGGTRSRGGNRLPFGDQESVSCDAERGVMVEAAPTAPFKVVKADLLLEILVIAFDAPTQLGKIDETGKANVGGQVRQPILCRFLLAFGPFDQEPFFRPRLAAVEVASCNANAHARKARFEGHVRSLAPSD